MRSADLRNADLSECDFKNSILHNALLSSANLTNAKLALASTIKTHFSGAILDGAQISQSTLSSANFAEGEASRAVVLDEAEVMQQRHTLRKAINDEIKRYPLGHVSVLDISDEEMFA